MTPATAVAILGFILDRAQAGFPILSELFKRRKKEVEAAAEAANTVEGLPPTVGAAPDAVKQFVIQKLTAMRDASSGWTRVLLTFAVNVAPTLADEVWDKIIALLNGRQDALPPLMGAASPAGAGSPFAAVAFADACDAVNID